MSRTQVGTRLLGAGSVIQTVFAPLNTQITSTTVMDASTLPVNTEGVEVLTCAITPRSATSILRVQYRGTISAAAIINASHALFRDSITNAVAANVVTVKGNTYISAISIDWQEVAGSLSLTTFKVRVGPDTANTLYINGNSSVLFGTVGRSSLTITEIAA